MPPLTPRPSGGKSRDDSTNCARRSAPHTHSRVEDIIDPRETRPLLVDFIHEAQDAIRAQLGQTSRIAFLP